MRGCPAIACSNGASLPPTTPNAKGTCSAASMRISACAPVSRIVILQASWLFGHREAGGLHDARPFAVVALDERSKILRRLRVRFERRVGQARSHLGRLQDVAHESVQLVDNLGRCVGRQEPPQPFREGDVRKALLAHGRNIWEESRTFRTADPERAQLAALNGRGAPPRYGTASKRMSAARCSRMPAK